MSEDAGVPAPPAIWRDGEIRLAHHHRPGRAPGIIFCGGFESDMTGTKAAAIAAWGAAHGQEITRFDYQGHGQSSGRFEDGTISDWSADVVRVLDRLAPRPQILVGSSMGAWTATLAALARPSQVVGLVGIASAADFTEDVIRPALGAEEQKALDETGIVYLPNRYGEAPTPITAALLEDGRRHLVLRAPIPFDGPVRLLHGMADADVPWQISLRLAERLSSQDIRVTLIKDGDHRLSRSGDIALLLEAVAGLVAALGPGDG